MNQIICTNSSFLYENSQKQNVKRVPKKALKIIFYLLSFISALMIIYYIFYRYDLYKSEQISKELIKSFNISTLYTNNASNNISNVSYANSLNSSVIGIIEINKINIIYPILSEISKDFLKIAPCKFYGPNINEVGNFCIAAHNYKNDSFFSNLSQMENGDIITLYDTSKNSVNYIVYDIYTAYATDLDCTNQNTNNLRIITLVTCDSTNNNYRTIVKAKEL